MAEPLNPVYATVTFKNAGGVATDVDADTSIVWKIYNADLKILDSETQTTAQADHVDTGQYRFKYTPPLSLVGEDFLVSCTGTLGGDEQTAWAREPVELPE